MKRILTVFLALAILASCVLFSACGKKDDPKETTANPTETASDTKPAETKPAETKPAETKPAETKPAPETKFVGEDDPLLTNSIDLDTVKSDNAFYTNQNGTEENAANLFDDSEDTKWCLNFDPTNIPTVTFQTYTPVSITSYEFWSANDTGDYPDRNPSHFILYGSDDEGETWHVLIDDDLDMEPYNLTPCDTVYLEKGTDPYSYFKLEITEIVGTQILQISTFSMYGIES